MQDSLENLESPPDQDSQETSNDLGQQANVGTTSVPSTKTNSHGYYDAEKCRAYIANQIRVSKIDRFAAQVCKAIEVESNIRIRLNNIMNMFVCVSAKVTYDFTLKCKLGLQRHQQDRILNQQRKSSKNKLITGESKKGTKHLTVSNDLLYGTGVQLIHTLLSQITPFDKRELQTERNHKAVSWQEHPNYNDEDYVYSDLFEPTLYVKKLEDYIKENLNKSKTMVTQISSIRQLFERLASKHRDNVDLVYAAEEERQAATVTRRSAYNLSIAAIKATSTPIHVNSSNEIS